MQTFPRQKVLIVGVITTVVVLALLVGASMRINKYSKNFRDEMAQRLDLEEKLTKMDSEHQALVAENDSLKEKIEKSDEEIKTLKEAIARHEEEKAVLKDSLEEAQKQLKGPMQK